MGTETYYQIQFVYIVARMSVKLNNPLMGTETLPAPYEPNFVNVSLN